MSAALGIAVAALQAARFGKFVRCAQRARTGGNPWLVPPLKTALPWTQGEAIVSPGQVRASAGRWYVSQTTGTSGGTANAAAPTHTTGLSTLDGTGGVNWLHYGPAESATDDLLAPVIVNQSGPFSGFSNEFGVYSAGSSFAAASKFAVRGGYLKNAIYAANGDAQIITLDQKPGITPTPAGSRSSFIEFETDEPSFSLFHNVTASPLQLVVNGRRVFADGNVAGAGNAYTRVTFPEGRKLRRVEVSVPSQAAGAEVRRVAVPQAGMIWAPASVDHIRAVFLSDSIWAGSSYGPNLVGGSVARRVSHALGWADPHDFSIGGTGYANPGAHVTFAQRVPEALTRKPDIWMLMGSTNDNGRPAGEVTAAVLATLRAIRAGSKGTPIVVYGVWPTGGAAATTAASLATEVAVAAAVQAFNDPLAFFIPLSAPTDGLPWVTWTWSNRGTMTGSFNGDVVMAQDKTHPVDLGTAYLALRIERGFRQSVLPKLAA